MHRQLPQQARGWSDLFNAVLAHAVGVSRLERWFGHMLIV